MVYIDGVRRGNRGFIMDLNGINREWKVSKLNFQSIVITNLKRITTYSSNTGYQTVILDKEKALE